MRKAIWVAIRTPAESLPANQIAWIYDIKQYSTHYSTHFRKKIKQSKKTPFTLRMMGQHRVSMNLKNALARTFQSENVQGHGKAMLPSSESELLLEKPFHGWASVLDSLICWGFLQGRASERAPTTIFLPMRRQTAAAWLGAVFLSLHIPPHSQPLPRELTTAWGAREVSVGGFNINLFSSHKGTSLWLKEGCLLTNISQWAPFTMWMEPAAEASRCQRKCAHFSMRKEKAGGIR